MATSSVPTSLSRNALCNYFEIHFHFSLFSMLDQAEMMQFNQIINIVSHSANFSIKISKFSVREHCTGEVLADE